MENSINPDDLNNGHTSNISSTLMGRYGGQGPGHHDALFGTNPGFVFPDFGGTVEPSYLDLSHTSHDDMCMSTSGTCPGLYNSQGIYRLGNPAAQNPRRFTAAPMMNAYTLTGGTFVPVSSSQYDERFSFSGFSTDIDYKYPVDSEAKPLSYATNINPNFYGFDGNLYGQIPQCPIPEDCTSVNCSQASCPSQCCSTQVCEGEACAEEGTPCDDIFCYENRNFCGSYDHKWEESYQDQGPHAGDGTIHGQPCNHTDADHDAAKALQHLFEPTSEPSQENAYPGFGYPVFTDVDYVGGAETLHPILENTPPLIADTPSNSPRETCTPSVSFSDSNVDPKPHTCLWAVHKENGEEAMCNKVFPSEEELQNHLVGNHIIQMSSKTKYRCCWHGCSRQHNQTFASRNKLRRHISTHTAFKPFMCEQCHTRFSAQQALDQHVRIHTGDKPYRCDYPGCEKSFKQKSALTMHKRTHSGEKPLSCEICGKTFCESSNLSKHRKTHSPEFKHECKFPSCNKKFIRQDQLRRHMEKHDRDEKKRKTRLRTSTDANGFSKVDVPCMPVIVDSEVICAA